MINIVEKRKKKIFNEYLWCFRYCVRYFIRIKIFFELECVYIIFYYFSWEV